MVAMTMTKPKPEPAAPSFETAAARWREIDAKHRALLDRREGMALAQSLTFNGDNTRTPQHLRDKAKPYLKLASRRPLKLDEQRADIADEIDEFTPVYQAAHENWQAARRRETNRLASEIQPRHQEAVSAIAKALEALSVAIDDEIATRTELAQVGAPEHESALLPDCSGDLLVGSLADWNSPASAWAREMRKIGILR